VDSGYQPEAELPGDPATPSDLGPSLHLQEGIETSCDFSLTAPNVER